MPFTKAYTMVKQMMTFLKEFSEDILDNMCSDELIANSFKISQTKQKIENEDKNKILQ